MTPDIRTIAREALEAEHRRLSHDPGSPPLPNALADAVALVVLKEAIKCMVINQDTLWPPSVILSRLLAAFQPETAPESAYGRSKSMDKRLTAQGAPRQPETATPPTPEPEYDLCPKCGVVQPCFAHPKSVSSVPVGEQGPINQENDDVFTRSNQPRVNREADLRGELIHIALLELQRQERLAGVTMVTARNSQFQNMAVIAAARAALLLARNEFVFVESERRSMIPLSTIQRLLSELSDPQ